MVAYLQNISSACKRLLPCSVKRCSRWRETRLLQRACTRPGTTQEHKWSYIWPSYSSCSDKAPDDFSGRFAWVENALSVPHCCCKVAGKKVVSDHKEIFSKLLPQSCSGTYRLAPQAWVTLLLGKSGAGIWPNRVVQLGENHESGSIFKSNLQSCGWKEGQCVQHRLGDTQREICLGCWWWPPAPSRLTHPGNSTQVMRWGSSTLLTPGLPSPQIHRHWWHRQEHQIRYHPENHPQQNADKTETKVTL